MPETFAVLFVVTVAMISFIASKIHARNPEVWNAREELKRLRVQHASLKERLEIADRENWEGEMRELIVTQLRSTRSQLAHMTAEMDDPREN